MLKVDRDCRMAMTAVGNIPACGVLFSAAHRWLQSCQFYAPVALYSPETLFLCFWHSFLFEAE
jgi:hypothetical protein